MEVTLALCLAVHVGALMAWFGALSLQRVLGRPAAEGRVNAGLVLAAALALASGTLWPLLETAVVLDDARAARDLAKVGAVLTQTSFGITWLAREAAIALALLAAALPGRRAWQAVYPLVAGALASVALVGHAAATQGMAGLVERSTLGLHLLAAGAWLGALPVLWGMCTGPSGPGLEQSLRRFSPYAMAMVAVVLTTGTLMTWERTGGPEGLLAGAYGRVLLAKVGLVFLMGLLALNNRNRLVPRLGRGENSISALRRSIGLETALGAAVIAAAALLGAQETPR